MSPTSSIPSTTAATSQARPVKPPHSRHASSATIPQAQQETSKPSSPRPAPIDNKPDVHYTVFIRLPFARGDFVDPEPVEWDGVKDRALWKIVSKSSNTKVCEYLMSIPGHPFTMLGLFTEPHNLRRASNANANNRSSTGHPSPRNSKSGFPSSCSRRHGCTSGTSRV